MIIQLHSVFNWQCLRTFSTDSLALVWHYTKGRVPCSITVISKATRQRVDFLASQAADPYLV